MSNGIRELVLELGALERFYRRLGIWSPGTKEHADRTSTSPCRQRAGRSSG